jgi:hypothetical protein
MKKKQGFAAHPELINRKGRVPSGTSIAEITRQFLEQKATLTFIVNKETGEKKTETKLRNDFINEKLFKIVMQNEDLGASVRAADSLRDRAYGKPNQSVDLKTQGLTVNIIPPENPEGA